MRLCLILFAALLIAAPAAAQMQHVRDPRVALVLPRTVRAAPPRAVTAAEFRPIRADVAGCSGDRFNCNRLRALRPQDFVALDIRPGRREQLYLLILPRRGGRACTPGGCYWYAFWRGAAQSANYGFTTDGIDNQMEGPE